LFKNKKLNKGVAMVDRNLAIMIFKLVITKESYELTCARFVCGCEKFNKLKNLIETKSKN
jgi:hypothetical protein